MSLIYLHGFASGPHSGKAPFFRRRLDERGVDMRIPDVNEGNFERLTITSQLRVIEREAGDGDVRLIGSSMGGYLAALYAARHAQVRQVVLLAPAFGFARRWPHWLGEQKVADWRRTGWLPVYH